ncbi:MAG: DUF1499 domain-containing protein [Phototrophicaceae bacterium]
MGLIIALLGAVGLYVVALVIIQQISPRPDSLGVRDGQLAPCPNTPNCVSTQASRDNQRMEPLTYTGDTGSARERLLAIVRDMPGATVVTAGDDYIHAEFRSRLWRFVDDVEFYIADGQIHFRSAARLGQGDMGVNRQRMQTISERFQAG